MKKNFLIFLILFVPLYSHTLKDRVQLASVGDYLVAKHKKTIALLRIAKKEKDLLIIEEINAPLAACKNRDWQKWISLKAPGHTSWILYEIDLKNNELIEAFSYTRMAWLQLSKKELFLLQLMQNPLKRVAYAKQKKVSSPLIGEEIDYRSPWSPPMVIQGEKIRNPKYEVYRSIWPNDGSELSQKKLQIYFDAKNEFFFPFWIEIIEEHFAPTLKVIDAGHNLTSPRKAMPHRPLAFFAKPTFTKDALTFSLLCPKYYEDFEIIALDVAENTENLISLDYRLRAGPNEKIEIIIEAETLDRFLTKNKFYKWLIKPKNSQTVIEWKEPLFFP